MGRACTLGQHSTFQGRACRLGLPADVGGTIQRFPALQGFRCSEGIGRAQLVGEPQAGPFFDFTDGHLEDPESVQLQCLKLVQVLGQQEASALQLSVVGEGEDFPVFPGQRDVAVVAVILSENRTPENADFQVIHRRPPLVLAAWIVPPLPRSRRGSSYWIHRAVGCPPMRLLFEPEPLGELPSCPPDDSNGPGFRALPEESEHILIRHAPQVSKRKKDAVLSIEAIPWANLLSQKTFHPSPHDWSDQVIYFLLIDRFSDGKEDGYKDVSGQVVQGQTPLFSAGDTNNAVATANDVGTWETAGTQWLGGTLKGIATKIGYLKRLGVTALWISPVLRQRQGADDYHGYGTQNFLEVDPHFGTVAAP